MKYWSKFGYLLPIMILTIAVYVQTVNHQFVLYDDPLNVFANPRVNEFSFSNLAYFWRHTFLDLYIPVTYNAWSLLSAISRWFSPDKSIAPWVFHLANIFLHLGNSLLVYLLFAKLLNNARAAVFGALLFAVHPLQVESVAWVTGFKDLLSTCWSLLAINTYCQWCGKQTKEQPRYRLYAISTLFFFMALLTKPSTVTVPVICGVIGYWGLGQNPRNLVRTLVPWLAATLPVIAIAHYSQSATRNDYLPNIWDRFIVAGNTITFYLGKLTLPVNLAADYGWTPEFILNQPGVYVAALFPCLLAAAALSGKAGKTGIIILGIITMALFPVLGFFPFGFQEISTVADRYFYLAMLGPAFGVAWLMARHRHQVIMAAAILLLTICAVLSHRQIRTWKNSYALYHQMIRVNPNSWFGYEGLGLAHNLDNRKPEALAAFKKATEIRPDYFDGWYSQGIVYQELGRNSQALEAFRRALEIRADQEVIQRIQAINRSTRNGLASKDLLSR